jgi:hypothetical protein
MMGRQDRQSGPIAVGDVRGTGIAIGHGSSAAVTQMQPAAQAEAAALLEEIIRQLALHPDCAADPAGALECAEAAQSELRAPSPRWRMVGTLLKRVATGAAGVSALAEAVSKVQALVAHLIA